MPCLTCAKHMALFRKLRGGGESCPDANRDKYQEEYSRLAVSRLLQPQTRPDEVKPRKKKAESRPATAVVDEVDDSHRGGTTAVAVEPEEAEIEVVAITTEYQHQKVSPAAGTREWMTVEYEPVITLNAPELVSVPEAAQPALEPAALQLQCEAGFLSLCP